MELKKNRFVKETPKIFIPSLYFIEGLPYTIVNSTSTVLFKSFGVANEVIGLTSFLYLPWSLKFLWAPCVDLFSHKKRWIVVSQAMLATLLLMAALGALSSSIVFLSILLFVFIGLVSATQDVAIDGYYLDVLNHDQQALYVGIRNTAYRLAMLFGSGGLVYIAGRVGELYTKNIGWAIAFAICAFLFFAAMIFHLFYLPNPQSSKHTLSNPNFAWSIFLSYFQQNRIIATVFYILFFRLGDALMLKMAMPFLLDSHGIGGLQLTIATVGIVYGTVGTTFLLLGGIIGGFLIAKQGLKRWLLPSAIIQNGAILLYWLLAIYKPTVVSVAIVNAVEQFAYGFGLSAYTVYLLSTVKSEYKASHYALATALMALGMMIPGAISGYLQHAVGYANFFLISFIATVPGILSIFFLPLAKPATSAPKS